MKRNVKISVILLVLILAFITPFEAFGDEYEDYLSSFDLSAFESLDSDTEDFLEELEIDSFDYQKISALSFSQIVNHLILSFKNSISKPLGNCVTLIVFILMNTFIRSFSGELENSEMKDFFKNISSLIICVFLAVTLTDTITLCGETISLCAKFAYAFFPAFCIIVSASGGVATSFSVNSMLLTLGQGLNYISELVFLPLTNCMLALGICSSLRKDINLTSLISSAKQIITTMISALAALFISVLSMKTAVSAKADALGLRSLRFAINSVVPVIGPSISEGLISIQSYSSMIKTSVGIVGIICVAFIFIPALTSVAAWRITLFFCKLCCDVFDDGEAGASVNAFREALLIIEVLLILCMLTTVISIGILVAARTVD